MGEAPRGSLECPSVPFEASMPAGIQVARGSDCATNAARSTRDGQQFGCGIEPWAGLETFVSVFLSPVRGVHSYSGCCESHVSKGLALDSPMRWFDSNAARSIIMWLGCWYPGNLKVGLSHLRSPLLSRPHLRGASVRVGTMILSLGRRPRGVSTKQPKARLLPAAGAPGVTVVGWRWRPAPAASDPGFRARTLAARPRAAAGGGLACTFHDRTSTRVVTRPPDKPGLGLPDSRFGPFTEPSCGLRVVYKGTVFCAPPSRDLVQRLCQI